MKKEAFDKMMEDPDLKNLIEKINTFVQADHLGKVPDMVCHFASKGEEDFDLYDFLINSTEQETAVLMSVLDQIDIHGHTEFLLPVYEKIHNEVNVTSGFSHISAGTIEAENLSAPGTIKFPSINLKS